MPADSLKFCVPPAAPAFSRARTNSRDRRVGACSGLLVLLVLLAALPAAAQTKDEKKAEAQLRVVHGLVGDKDENPIPSSVVYLVNVKTKAVKTSFADEKGQYRFSGLDPNVDYEIHAEHGDLTSSTRTISSFDSRRDIEVNLKVTKTKKD